MRAIYRKELIQLFGSLTGYVFASMFLLAVGGLCILCNFIGAYSGFEYTLNAACLPMLIMIPLLTARTFTDERRQGTERLLYSLPLDMKQIVLGKFFALVTVLAVLVLIIAAYPLILSRYGQVNLLTAYGTLIGFFFLLCCMCAIGLFLSSLAENQLIATVLTFILFAGIYLIPSVSKNISTSGFASFFAFTVVFILASILSYSVVRNSYISAIVFVILELPFFAAYMADTRLLSGKFASMLSQLALFDRFMVFSQGVFDATAVVYFVSITVFFVFLTVESLEVRRKYRT